FDLSSLITIAMFFLGVCYLLTGLAALRLIRQAPQRRLRLPGLPAWLALAAAGGLALSLQAPPGLIAARSAALALGLLGYVVGEVRRRRAGPATPYDEKR